MLKKRNGSKWIRRARRLGIYLRDKFTCVYCSKDLHNVRPNQITLDHIVPWSLDGGNESTNLITACIWCNSKRGDTTIQTFLGGDVQDLERVHCQLTMEVPIDLAKRLLAKKVSKKVAIVEAGG